MIAKMIRMKSMKPLIEQYIMHWLSGRMTVLDDVLNVFGLTNETITRYLEYTKQMTFGFDVVKYNDIVTQAIWYRSLDRVKKIMGMIGETCFVDHVFKRDGSNRNGLDLCIDRGEGGSDTFKYLMSFSSIKEKCINDINILWTMIW
eukprot:425835_1